MGVNLGLSPKGKIRELRRIFGPQSEERGGGWTELHNEELHEFKFFIHVLFRTIKSRSMRWA